MEPSVAIQKLKNYDIIKKDGNIKKNDNISNEDNIRKEDNFRNENDIRNKDDIKNEDNLKMKTNSRRAMQAPLTREMETDSLERDPEVFLQGRKENFLVNIHKGQKLYHDGDTPSDLNNDSDIDMIG